MTLTTNFSKLFHLHVSFLIISSILLTQPSTGRSEEIQLMYSGGVLFSVNEEEELKRLSDIELISHKDQVIPDTFRAEEKWPQCESIRRVSDEGDCGYSWAVALTTALTDRHCIASNGTDKFEYSAEDLLTCCPDCGHRDFDNLCDAGGDLVRAVEYLQEKGLVSGDDSNQGCKPRSSRTVKRSWSRSNNQCKRTCSKKYRMSYVDDKRRVKKITYAYNLKSAKDVQIEILRNGPVVGVIRPPEEFRKNITNDVQKFASNNSSPGYYGSYPRHYGYRPGYHHAVTYCGWGIEGGQRYWHIRNSWGYGWGDRGHFKYAMCTSSDGDCDPVEGEKHMTVIALQVKSRACLNRAQTSRILAFVVGVVLVLYLH